MIVRFIHPTTGQLHEVRTNNVLLTSDNTFTATVVREDGAPPGAGTIISSTIGERESRELVATWHENTKIAHYPVAVHETNGEYLASFPCFRDCCASGDSQEEALREAHRVLQEHVDAMRVRGVEVPKPSADILKPPKIPDLDTDGLVAVTYTWVR